MELWDLGCCGAFSLNLFWKSEAKRPVNPWTCATAWQTGYCPDVDQISQSFPAPALSEWFPLRLVYDNFSRF